MRTFLTLLLLILLGNGAYAQTQQGIVKTRGRMVDGKVVPGTRLQGATITLNFGNPLVSGKQGTFSFTVPSSKSFSLVSVSKQGYTLADPEYTKRMFQYSAKQPFYVVLEDETQRQADINAATRKVRKTLTAQLEKREMEVEALRAQNRLTEKEYQRRMKEVYDNQSKAEQLVKAMAEHYASTDYDQLDEFNLKIQLLIEDGELQRADSLICSKGSIEQRMADYRSIVAANKSTREKLEKSEMGAAKTYQDLTQDLLRRTEIFLQQFQQDSALYCLKLRADLDTTNADAVRQYATLAYHQKKFVESETYYHICLRAYIRNNDVANMALTQNNLGNVYLNAKNYVESERFYKMALANREKLVEQNPDAYRMALAMTQNNLGSLFMTLRDYENGMKYYMMSLKNKQQAGGGDSDENIDQISTTQYNIGILYKELKDYASSEKYYKMSLENRERLFERAPNEYRASLASTQQNLGNLYALMRDFENSVMYYTKAMEHGEILFAQNPDAYRIQLAKTINNLANVYADMKRLDDAIAVIDRGIEVRPERAELYDSKGEFLLMQGKTDEALRMWHKVLELNPDFQKKYPDGTGLSNGLKKLGFVE